MNIKFLGASNSNPNPGMGQSGILLEFDGANYLFDCGDGIPTKIWLDKTVVMNDINAIFISHFDADHVGGIFPMIHLMHQRIKRSKENQPGRNGILEIFIPGEEAKRNFDEMASLFRLSEEYLAYKKAFVPFFGEQDIYEDSNIKVSSFPTFHKQEGHGFVITAGEKKIIFSGDASSPEVMSAYVDNADIVITEGAHFPIEKIPPAFTGKNIKTVIITHLNDDKIKNNLAVIEILKPLSGECNILFARDGMEIPI